MKTSATEDRGCRRTVTLGVEGAEDRGDFCVRVRPCVRVCMCVRGLWILVNLHRRYNVLRR